MNSSDFPAPERVPLPDGRVLGVRRFGAPGGRPVLYFNGWPSSSLEGALGAAAAARAGILLLALDRPGMGASSPHPGRTLLSWSGDVAAVLERLGIARCGIVAVSGGTPYALACAQALPAQVAAVAVVSGLGRVDRPEGLRRMALLGRLLLPFARRWPTRLALLMRPACTLSHNRPGTLAWVLTHLGASATDRAAVRETGTAPLLAAMVTEALQQGTLPAAEELSLFAQPWGFDTGAVRQPVEWWHGTADPVVPLALAEWMVARLPAGRMHALPGEGHYSLGLLHADAILQSLLAAWRAAEDAEP